ncbi:MAG TPA: beta-galactosidase [Terriglobales bacterium]|nr:beta-galactosidase [Terriglobales bacterium]
MSTLRFPATIRVFVAFCAFSSLLCAQTAPALRALPQPAPHVEATGIEGPQSPSTSRFLKMTTAIGDDYFDGRDSRGRVRRHLNIARKAGVSYLRFGFSWNGVEPAQGEYRFEFWDMLVEEAGRAGIQLMPYIAYTPEWAARSEQDFWKQPPKDPALYTTIVRKLVERYRGKIRIWELWNEPDNLEYWTGTADEFAATMIPAALAAREVAPETTLVLGGLTQGPGEFFQKLIRDHQIERYFDVLALHAYPESWHELRAETVFQQVLPEMQRVAQQSGRPVWLNEMGYADYRFAPNKASLYGTSAYYNYEHTQRYAADFLFKSYTMTLASGAPMAGWYRIDDFVESDPRMPSDKVHHHLGVTDIRGKPKPAFYALKFFNTLFASPTRVVCSPQGPALCATQEDSVTPASDVAPAARRLSRGRPALAATETSQSTVNIFQRKDSTLILTGWLRSSNHNEVASHTGMEQDRRRERINIQLPCTAHTVRTFDALGKQLSTRRLNSSTLPDVILTGDRVFIAKVTCRPATRP